VHVIDLLPTHSWLGRSHWSWHIVASVNVGSGYDGICLDVDLNYRSKTSPNRLLDGGY
jgi:hypothetical protein